jgi:oligo-1,6-glucosidase
MYPNDESKRAYARKVMQRKARDHARTPVQWDASPHAGFTSPSSTPWMRVNDDYKDVNVSRQVDDSNPATSVFAFWKRGLENRKKHKDIFIYGDFELIDAGHEKIVAYKRWSKDETVLVVLNFSSEQVEWKGMGGVKVGKWWAGNYDEKDLEEKDKEGTITLRPWEGLIGGLDE